MYYFDTGLSSHFLKIDLKTHKFKEVDSIHAQKSRIFVQNLYQVVRAF